MKIAIIGSGISGLYAAYKLSKIHHITLFEKNAYFGGHTDTHSFSFENSNHRIDSGFIVFNEHNYPVFCNMLKELDVEWQKSDMSFSVYNRLSGFMYNPSTLAALLVKPANFLRKDFRLMLKDLFRFYRENIETDIQAISADVTLGEYLDQHHYSYAFRNEHIYPMCGALWSATGEQIQNIPFKFALSFFQNHAMLQLTNRPQWLTLKAGSNSYIKAIRQKSKNIQWYQEEVTSVQRCDNHIAVSFQNTIEAFDWVVMACHGDQTLKLLKNPTRFETEILSAFRYQPNRMIVHSDNSIMPKAKSQWASWHVHVAGHQTNPEYGYTYWMNRLQNLNCKTDIFASLNCPLDIDPNKILIQRSYEHPIFDSAALNAQSRWQEINGKDRISYCGAYWGWGFHEDGALSSQRAVDHLISLTSV